MIFLLHQLLATQAARHPQATALISDASTVTYGELDRHSDAVARALAVRGAGPGTPVGLLFDKSCEAIVALFGILKSGAAYVPLDPCTPPARLAAIAGGCGLTHLVLSAALAENTLGALRAALAQDQARFGAPAAGVNGLAHALVPGPVTARQREMAGATAIASWDDAPDAVTIATPVDLDLAYILHTSGSTGRPKGVAITHGNALCFVNMAGAYFAVNAGDRLACHAPLYSDLSVFDLFVAMAAGAAVVLMPPYLAAFPQQMSAWIERHRITVWNSVASALTLLIDRGQPQRFCLDSLRLVLSSGEAMPIRVLRQLRRQLPHAQLYNVYGQTEANSSMCYHIADIPADDGARLPIGRPFPNFEVFALDSCGRVVTGPGVEGDLYVRAGTVAAGYWGDPERTAQVFIADPRAPVTGGRVYATGDRVTVDEQGQYVFVGRTDSLIKSRGYRIDLGEVELVISACQGVGQAAVVTVPDTAIGNRICAFVCPHPDVVVCPEVIAAQCRTRLPAYMIPEQWHMRPALPQTATGKIDRNALQAELIG